MFAVAALGRLIDIRSEGDAVRKIVALTYLSLDGVSAARHRGDVLNAARSLYDEQRLLLAKYIEAFEALDISGLIELLRADMAMGVAARRPEVGRAAPAA